jgi:hypothetical protein
MTPQELTQHANALKDNPLLTEIFDAIDDGLIEKSRTANTNNEKEMLAIVLGFQIKNEMIDFIRTCLNNEKVIEYNQSVQKRKIL